MRWLKRRFVFWALNLVGADPSILANQSALGDDIEILIESGRIWINIDGTCRFRAIAKRVRVINGRLATLQAP